MVPAVGNYKNIRRISMKKKILAAILAISMVALTACGTTAAPAADTSAPAADTSADTAAPAADTSADTAAPAATGAGKKVAVAMPTQARRLQ